MRKTFYLLLSILLLSLSCFSQDAVQNLATAEGNLLQVRLKPVKEKIMLGESTYILFEVKNLSAKDLYTPVPSDYPNLVGRLYDCKVTVVRDNGESAPPSRIIHKGKALNSWVKIPANGSFYQKIFLPDWATFEEAGTYTVTFEKTLETNNYIKKAQNFFDVKLSIEIEVIPTDSQKLGEVIDSLAERMLDEKFLRVAPQDFNYSSNDALFLLKVIKDRRVIKYFGQFLEKYGRGNPHFEKDIMIHNTGWTLTDYPEDAVLEILKKFIDSPNQKTRLVVAETFQRIKHPQALPLLLKMRYDDYWLVRLRVLQAYGDQNSEDAESLRQQMLADKEQTLRNAAQNYLHKRQLN